MNAYRQAWQQIVKPPSFPYYDSDLGNPIMNVNGHSVLRHDFSVANRDDLKLRASYYSIEGNDEDIPCVIYLHTHSGNRLEGHTLVRDLIPRYALCSFDFSGCGHSEGEYVTLGFKEIWDLDSIIDHLRKYYGRNKFILWGRSMGAVTAIMYAHEFKEAASVLLALVLDSPFSDAKTMIADLLTSHSPNLPRFLISSFLFPISQTLKSQTGYPVLSSSPRLLVSELSIPSIYIVAKEDKISLPSRVQELHDKHKGVKKLLIIEGEHNSWRDHETIDSVVEWLCQQIADIPQINQLRGDCEDQLKQEIESQQEEIKEE